jgi:hypothetical protein
MRAIVLAALLAAPAFSSDLRPQTLEAFERYIRQTEQRLDARKNFLWADETSERAARIRGGQIAVEPTFAKPVSSVPNGLVHDWVGSVFLPGVSLEKTMSLMRDYNRHKEYFRPEVVDSRILSHDDNHFRIFLRLLKKQVITVVLDTEHDVQYTPISPARWRSVSRTTRISEVSNAGKPDEHVKPPDTGQGFLWRLVSYWRFEERDGGTWVECEAVSLTRDIPTGLGWMIEPIIRNLPKQSLENTMREARAAFH